MLIFSGTDFGSADCDVNIKKEKDKSSLIKSLNGTI